MHRWQVGIFFLHDTEDAIQSRLASFSQQNIPHLNRAPPHSSKRKHLKLLSLTPCCTFSSLDVSRGSSVTAKSALKFAGYLSALAIPVLGDSLFGHNMAATSTGAN